MNNQMTRRRWIGSAAGVVVSASLVSMLHAQDATPTTQPDKPIKKNLKGPPIAPELVKEFVGAGHGNLDRVKEMLAQYPKIANGVWDWGGGDYESALGGASHMGRADIAVYLIEHGARMDIFAAAMLGKVEIVKAACVAFPNTPTVAGPHGITLMQHAQKGGAPAQAVVDYLVSIGC